MKTRHLKTLVISASFLVLCAACSSSDKDGVDLETPWLGPLHGFERLSGKDNSGIFLKDAPGTPVRFERSVLAPPEFIVSASSDLESISPAAYEQIKTLFADVFRQEMAKQISTANTGSERSAATHAVYSALTNVTITRKTNSARAARLSDLVFSFEGSTLEVEIRVRRSNARRAVIVLPAKAGNIAWNDLRGRLAGLVREAAAEVGKAGSAINAKADQPPPAVKTPAKK